MSHGPRVIILHYHLFKNAGTSVDEILKQNFGDRWSLQEFPRAPGHRSNAADIGSWLEQHANTTVLSSHTALLPLPAVANTTIIPILFVRHPLDRLRSAYDFERRQQADTRGAKLAKETDLAGYLREVLGRKWSPARNFQTVRLAHNEAPKAGSQLERAMRTLRSLPFIGLVEEFDRSIDRLSSILKPYFPDFQPLSARKNTSSKADSLDMRLAEMRAQIGDELFEELLTANTDDLAVYEHVKRLYMDRAPRELSAKSGGSPVLQAVRHALQDAQVQGALCLIGRSSLSADVEELDGEHIVEIAQPVRSHKRTGKLVVLRNGAADGTARRLKTAETVLKLGGAVLLTDYRNKPHQPAGAGLEKYLATAEPRLSPVAVIGGVLVLTRAASSQTMKAAIEQHLNRQNVATRTRKILGFDVTVKAAPAHTNRTGENCADPFP